MKEHLSYFGNKKNSWCATSPTWNFGSNWSCWSKNANFQSIFGRSTSAV